MGFGILFLGFLLFFPNCVGFFYTIPLGAILVFFACQKLAKVNVPFGKAGQTMFLLFPVSILAIVFRLVQTLSSFAPYFEALTLLLLLLTHLLICVGIKWVSVETDVPFLKERSVRVFVYSFIYFIPTIILTIIAFPLSEELWNFISGFSKALVIVGVVFELITLYLIYRTYTCICMPEDVEMKRKPSKFAFINRLREKEDRAEEEQRDYYIQKKKQKMQKRRNENSHD